MNFKAMFDDQRAFNRQIFPDHGLPEEVDEVLKSGTISRFHDRLRHLALGMVEETLEFLRTYEWKSHRRHKGKLQNVAHSHEELVDMLKYWLSLADLADFPIDQLEALYYAKSRVVQYRYQEEWMKEVSGPCVVVDIDNVLADYITGMCNWAQDHGPKLLNLPPPFAVRFVHRLEEIRQKAVWLNAGAVGVSEDQWRLVKHHFRISGGKQSLPVFPEAMDFLTWCRQQGWLIILITSRPIDRYPNIFTDTMTWLHDNKLPFDHLWWADKKEERLQETHIVMRSQIVFAVDDGLDYVHQFHNKGIKTYWLTRTGTNKALRELEERSGVFVVSTLSELMEKEKMAHGI